MAGEMTYKMGRIEIDPMMPFVVEHWTPIDVDFIPNTHELRVPVDMAARDGLVPGAKLDSWKFARRVNEAASFRNSTITETIYKRRQYVRSKIEGPGFNQDALITPERLAELNAKAAKKFPLMDEPVKVPACGLGDR